MTVMADRKSSASDNVRFIWINPVISRMAGDDYPALLERLVRRGYRIAACPEAADEIRGTYISHLDQSPVRPLIDARCPRIVSLIREKFPALLERVAPIPPILILCAERLYRRHCAPDPRQTSLTIITPCSELVDYGKSLFGERILFLTWKDFRRDEALLPLYPRAEASPIPPGFFNFPGIRVLEGSGPQTVTDLLGRAEAGRIDTEVAILELLYCRDGCHNGNGV